MSVCFLVFFVVGLLVYPPYMLRVAFLLPSFNKIFCVYLSKKKNTPPGTVDILHTS